MASHSSHANRGAALEQYVELANAQYRSLGIAQIQKVAVPTRVVHNRREDVAEVVRQKSTVDFVGAWNGRAVAFDAKENQEATRFDLANVQPHQVDFLRLWHQVDGVAFLLLLHQPHQSVYLVPGPLLFRYWDNWRGNSGRASLPVEEISRLPRVHAGRGCTLDYLKTVESWLHYGGR